MHTFLEHNHPIHIAPKANQAAGEDMFNGNIASDVISLENAHGAVFIVTTLSNAGGTASCRVLACDDTTPTATVAVSFRFKAIEAPDTLNSQGESKAYQTSTAHDMVYVFEVDAAKLAEQGYKYCQFEAVEDDDAAVDGSVVGFLTGLRYKEDDIDDTQAP
jgi:hypothetical protein